jgi:hypothetical protein
MNIKLLVVRTESPKRLSEFYSLLGLEFEYHSHGMSPMHYSARIGNATLEVYPLMKGQAASDKGLRIGLTIDDFDNRISFLRNSGVIFSLEPSETEFGLMAVVIDPDGRRLELYK